MNAELLAECRNTLGEGIRWHVPTQRLYWVDIQEARLWSCDADGQQLRYWQLKERIAAFAFTASDRILVAQASGFAYFYPGDGRTQRLESFEPTKVTTRLNDGTTDRDGNFICGGMDELNMDRISSVVQLTADGRQRTLLEAVGCSNSLALSRNGRQLYFADTSADRIYRFDYDATAGELRHGRVFATLQDGTGRPDGSTIEEFLAVVEEDSYACFFG
jgi:L-arabinonolactonase